MRKLFFLLLIFCYSESFSQNLTYTIQAEFVARSSNYSYVGGFTNCNSNTYYWTLQGTNINEYLIPNISTFTTKTYIIAVNSIYNLTTQAYCDCVSNQPSSGSCIKFTIQTIQSNSTIYQGHEHQGEGINGSIKSGGYAIGPNQGTPFGMIMLKNFTPNGITINRIKTTAVCAGEDIELQALNPSPTEDFPDEAYHYQYSIDNQVTWIDVPAKGAKGNDINNEKISTFTIYDIFGDDHINHFGPIDFRIGYAGRPFSTNTVTINYLPCAPIIKKIEYLLAPLCNGDNIRDITLTFDRDLKFQEELRDFQLRAVNPVTNIPIGTPSVYYPMISDNNPKNGLITTFDEKKPNVYTYTLSNFKGLNPNDTYQISYQAFQNNIERGVEVSPKTENFKYEEPAEFNFTATPIPALCYGSNGAIEIVAWGGTGTFKYKLDSDEEKIFVNPLIIDDNNISKQKIVIEVKSNPNPNSQILTNHSIIVTDSNGCIDKSAND